MKFESAVRHTSRQSQGRLLAELFSSCETDGVSYCVLRAYENLPDDVSHDVDLLIHTDSLVSFENILQEASSRCAWHLVQKIERFRFRSFYLVERDKPLVPLKIDVWTQIHWKGLPYAEREVVLAKRKRHNGIWVAGFGSEAAVSLLKEYVRFGWVKSRDGGRTRERISRLSCRDPASFIATVQPCLGPSLAEFLLESAQGSEWSRLERYAGEVRKALVFRSLSRRPGGQIIDWFRFLLGHLSDKLLQPRGLFVCFIGPDGSGKTTTARGLEKSLEDWFEGVSYYHGHIGILPELKRYAALLRRMFARGKKAISSGENDNDEGSRSFGLPRALMYVLYYFFDYFLGHFVIRYRKAKGELIIFDRYFYDYMLQPNTSCVPRWLLRTLERLLPRPDVLVWLRNRPKVIHLRKPELQVKEIQRQIDACQAIASRSQRSVIVDTRDIETTIKEVSGIVIRRMATRARWNR